MLVALLVHAPHQVGRQRGERERAAAAPSHARKLSWHVTTCCGAFATTSERSTPHAASCTLAPARAPAIPRTSGARALGRPRR